MVYPPPHPSELLRKKKALTRELQSRMCSHFLEHTMYDVNDALTSILALCDVEGMKTLPKIKQYIQRVNQLLQGVQVYQDHQLINVNHVLKNVITILKDQFKERTLIETELAEIKALARSEQFHLERLLLFVFIELLSSEGASAHPIRVTLCQKEKDAQITIQRDAYTFSASVLEEIELYRADFEGHLQISPKGKGVEVTIRLPLSFRKPPVSSGLPASAASSAKTAAGKTAGKTASAPAR